MKIRNKFIGKVSDLVFDPKDVEGDPLEIIQVSEPPDWAQPGFHSESSTGALEQSRGKITARFDCQKLTERT